LTRGQPSLYTSPIEMRRLLRILALFAGVLLFNQPAVSAPPLEVEVNRIIAKVNDAVVTEADVRGYVDPNLAVLRRIHAGQPDVFAQKAAQLWRAGIQELVNRQLLLDDFKKSGLVLPENVIDDFIAARIKEEYTDRATLTKSLQAKGDTFESFRQNLKEAFIVEQMILRNISSAIIISPFKVETYYAEHTNDFKLPDQIHLRVIDLKKAGPADTAKPRLARELHGKLKENVPFADLAKVYSEGAHRDVGGDWGWFELSVLRKELGDVARTLKPGQHSDVIETADSCYLLKLEAARTSHIKPLAEVRAEIESILVARERARLQGRYIERLTKKAFIRFFPD